MGGKINIEEEVEGGQGGERREFQKARRGRDGGDVEARKGGERERRVSDKVRQQS